MERTMAVADPSRWQMVRLLEEQPRTVTQLAQAAGLSVAATCRHLQRLRAVGLVEARRRGKELQCRPVSPETPIGQWLAGLLAGGPSTPAAHSPRGARITVRPTTVERAGQAPSGSSRPSDAEPAPPPEQSERPRQYRELEDFLL